MYQVRVRFGRLYDTDWRCNKNWVSVVCKVCNLSQLMQALDERPIQSEPMWLHHTFYSWTLVEQHDFVLAVSSSQHAWALVVHGFFLSILTNFLSSEGDCSRLPPNIRKVEIHSSNFYLHRIVWTNDVEICNYLEMAPRGHPSLYKSICTSPP